MKTKTLFENGDTFEITYKTTTIRERNKKYFMIDNVLCELISKIKTNNENVNAINSRIRSLISANYELETSVKCHNNE